MQVYLNGRFVPAEQATVSVHDAGFQHAVGLFETMAAYHGVVFRLEAHLDRLAASARELGLAPTLHTPPLAEAVQATIDRNRQAGDLPDGHARVRLTLTPGAAALRPGAGPASEPPQPTLLITVEPPTAYDPAYFQQGIMALVAPPSANPFDQLAGHKTLSYWDKLRTLRQAAAAGAGEAIRLNVTNHLASGCVSNVFLVKDGELLTPLARGEEPEGGLGAPVLPGITRSVVFELADQESIAVRRRMLTVEDLLGADEVFLTNSSWQVLPVTRVEKSVIGVAAGGRLENADEAADGESGEVGPITRRLRELLMTEIAAECGGRLPGV